MGVGNCQALEPKAPNGHYSSFSGKIASKRGQTGRSLTIPPNHFIVEFGSWGLINISTISGVASEYYLL